MFYRHNLTHTAYSYVDRYMHNTETQCDTYMVIILTLTYPTCYV